MIFTDPTRIIDSNDNLWLGLALLGNESFDKPLQVAAVPISITGSSNHQPWTLADYFDETHDATLANIRDIVTLADITTSYWVREKIDNVYVSHPESLDDMAVLKRFCNEDLMHDDEDCIRQCILEQAKLYLESMSKVEPRELADRLTEIMKATVAKAS